jgi:hypothetical protein
MRLLICCALIVLLAQPAIAQIENPQLVSSALVRVEQQGRATLAGHIEQLTVNITIPQSTAWQSRDRLAVKCGACEHKLLIDEFGNELVQLSWQRPVDEVDFLITSTVSISRARMTSLPALAAFAEPSELVESADPEIISLAEVITSPETEHFSKIAAVTAWVHQNIEYDPAYMAVNMSAKASIARRAGTCDEFSVVLLALMRSLGYRSAYAAGYAYEPEKGFVAHGWTEICPDGCYVADPTWAQAGFLDAMHIKFATLPDSFYSEARLLALGRGEFAAVLEPISTDIEILEWRAEPVLTANSTLLDSELWTGRAIVKTDLQAAGCVLTKIRAASCTIDDEPFLPAARPEQIVWFCGARSLFSIFEIPPGLDPRKDYHCELSVIPAAAERTDTQLVLRSVAAPVGNISLALDRDVLVPGELFSVSAADAHIFTDYGAYARNSAVWTSPGRDFMVYAYRNGLLAQRQIAVVAERPINISLDLSTVDVMVGEVIDVSVAVTNKLTKRQSVTVRLGNVSQTKAIQAGQTELFEFTFTPASVADNIVQVFVLADTFSTSSSKGITVTKPKSWPELLLEAIMNFFKMLLGG